ncbi:MAG: hypothetical protein RBT36_10490 [Desulfobulbus sp.]|nr:hypothetical protein [Desulfobulbus sp.]
MKPTPLEDLVGRAIGNATRPLSRAAIEAWQGEQLSRLITYCTARSPYYRRKLAGRGTAIRGLDDLAALPLTTEAELRSHGAEMVCVSQDAVARIISLHSSGTTGPAKRLWFTEADLEQTLDFFHLGMGQMADPGEGVAILLPGATPDSTGDLLARAVGRLQARSTILGLAPDPVQAAQAIATVRPEVLVGLPVQILALARMAAHLGLELAPVRAVLLCSDYIPTSLSRSVQQLLGCEVFTHYGTVETGLGGAVDCTAHCGCHLREADLLVEIIDPQTCLPVADATWGEIVCTTLTRTGTPLIRYRTGDRGRLLPGPCDCTSNIRRLDRVRGRIDQVRTLHTSAQLSLPELDELLFTLSGLLDFSATLVTRNGQEELHVRLTTVPGEEAAVQRLATDLLRGHPSLRDLVVMVDLVPGTLIHPAKRRLEDLRKDHIS